MNPPHPHDPSGEAPGKAEVLVLTPNGQREWRDSHAVRGYEFRHSGFLAPSELRRIRLRHEQFIRSLTARLAIFLRLEFAVQLLKVQIARYQEFTEALPSPTFITLFRIDPLKGAGLLVIPPRLGLGLVDRLLGGSGQMPQAPRELSEIEVALTDQIASLLLTEWCNHWPEMRELKPALLGHENNSRFLQTSPAEAAMLVLTLEAGLGSQLEPVQLAFPYATIEPLLRQLAPPLPESERGPVRPAKLAWNPQFDHVKVQTRAEWHGLKISTAGMARLKVGDVLMLAPGCATQVQLRLNQVPKFLGRPGVRGSKWAVQLTELVNT